MVNKNLMYRKTLLKTIYRFSKVLDEVMEYEDYKTMILNGKTYNNKYEKCLKSLFESFNFLIKNDNKTFNPLVIYLMYSQIFKEKSNKQIILSLYKSYIPKENVIDEIINVIKNIYLEDKYEKYVLGFIIINYIIYLKTSNFYNFSNKFFKHLYDILNVSLDYELLKNELNKELSKSILPDIHYYENLVDITKEEIINFLIENESLLKEKYDINNLYLYGSFVKGSQRIDSDIDIAIVFNQGLSFNDKSLIITKLKQFILTNFKRYGDFMEYNSSLLNEKHKKIF